MQSLLTSNVQVIIDGIASGASIALLATAFQVVYLPARVFFVGLAGLYAVCPFVAYTCLQHGLGMLPAAFCAIIVGIAISTACEWANHSQLAKRHASTEVHLVASLGIYIVLVQIAIMLWGNSPRTLRREVEIVSRFKGVIVTGSQWTTIAVTMLTLALFYAVLMRSSFGLRLRGLADNPNQFALIGYNIRRHRLLAFALAGLFVAASSLLKAYEIGFDPHDGLHRLLLAVVAVIIGGKNSFVGPAVGAVVLGALRAQVDWYASARWEDAATFLLLSIFLLVRPEGLLGKKSRLEASAGGHL